MFPAYGRRLLCRFPGPRCQSGHGIHCLLDSALTLRQFCGQLIPALILTVPAVFLVIRLPGPPQQPGHRRRQPGFLLFHPLITHRLVLDALPLTLVPSRDTWPGFTTHPSLPGPAPILTSKGSRRRLPVPCPFSFACSSVGISARKTASLGPPPAQRRGGRCQTDAKTPAQTVAPEEYALDRIITYVSTNGSNPGLALHANSSGVPDFKLCDLRNATQAEHRIPWSGARISPSSSPRTARTRRSGPAARTG